MDSEFKFSKVLSLDEIFNEGNRHFEIPDYQRAYSWETNQRKDLMDDIENLINPSAPVQQNYKHFTGTIVANDINRFDSIISESRTFEIVDGQQRLTSLVILLSLLSQFDTLDAEYKTYIRNRFLFKGHDTGNTVRIFKLNGDLDFFLLRKLQDWKYSSEIHSTKAHRNIDDAFEEYNTWITSKSKENPNFAREVADVVINRLGFLLHVPESNAEIGLMFEVINNRGKKLSELEKIKNYLIYFGTKTNVNDVVLAVESNWGDILTSLNACGHTSNEQENSFLRYAWIVFDQTNKAESHHVYENLKIRYPATPSANWQKLIRFIEFLAEAAKAYNKIYSPQNIINEREKKVVQQLMFQAATSSVLPLVLAVYSKVHDREDRVQILGLIEKLNFRYYGCGIASRADTGNGFLFNLAHSFFNSSKNLHEEVENLKSDLTSFISRECSDERFIKSLSLTEEDSESEDFYSWNNLKYFLANYEEGIATENGELEDFTRFLLAQNSDHRNANFEKEHIIACEECSVLDSSTHLFKRKLGNFVLLRPSVNKAIKHAPLYEKIKKYRESTDRLLTPRSLMQIETIYGVENVNFGKEVYTYELLEEFIVRREKVLIQFALYRWGI